ncbi:fimbrial protein [Bacteroides rodentium]
MKKQILFLSALMALGFSGCSNEENIETGNSEEIRVAVTFDIGTRATNDSYLNEVTLYTFKADGEFVDAQNTTMTSGSITFPGKGSYLIEAIANEKVALQDLKSYEDFKTRTTVYTNATTDHLQMRDVQTATVTNANSSPSIHFSMRRLVSRINIVNNVEDFVLTEAHLQGAMSQSYFYKGEDDMDYWNLTDTETKTVTTFTPSTAGGNTYNSVFYVYECPNGKCNLALDVKGTIDGIEHAVPTLDKTAFTGNHDPLRRNAQYTVALNEVDGAIVATLEVSDWEEGEETDGTTVSPNGNTIEVEVTAAATTGSDYTIATEAEREVKDLSIYLFNAEGTLEKACTDLKDAAWTPGNTGSGKKVILRDILNAEAKTLYVVANAAATGTTLTVTEGITTTTAFEALTATAATQNLSCPLLMFKKLEISAKDGWNEEGVAQVSAVLERAAARIDLRVNAESGFTPETVKLVGANDQSLVIASTAATATTPLTLETAVETSEPKDGYLNCPQLFYTYSIGSTEGMYLLLEGVQQSGEHSAQAIYKKPLKEMEGFGKIDHNTCYTITIDDVDGVPLVTEGEIGGGVVDD